MRLIDASGVPADEQETYSVRGTVQAVRCDDGVDILGEQYDGAHVVVIDGDNYTAIESDIFDALYAPAQPLTAEQIAAAATQQTTAPTAPPTSTAEAVAAEPGATVTPGDTPPPTSETVLTGTEQDTAPTDPAGTPSVTDLTTPSP